MKSQVRLCEVAAVPVQAVIYCRDANRAAFSCSCVVAHDEDWLLACDVEQACERCVLAKFAAAKTRFKIKGKRNKKGKNIELEKIIEQLSNGQMHLKQNMFIHNS